MFPGIRLNELRNVRMSDVQFAENRVFVRCGKGAKDRFIPMNPELLGIPNAYIRDRDRLKRHCPHFFVALRRDEQMGDQAIPRLVQKLRDASGVYFSAYMLRHTVATLMLEGGVFIFAISKMMGHSDIRTTTIHLSATTSHLEGAVARHPLGNAAFFRDHSVREAANKLRDWASLVGCEEKFVEFTT